MGKRKVRFPDRKDNGKMLEAWTYMSSHRYEQSQKGISRDKAVRPGHPGGVRRMHVVRFQNGYNYIPQANRFRGELELHWGKTNCPKLACMIWSHKASDLKFNR
jgi:hypothetical protein